MQRAEALILAAELTEYLTPKTSRLSLAGSLRRIIPSSTYNINEIDFVAIDRFEERREKDLFGEYGIPTTVSLTGEAVDQIERTLGTWRKAPRTGEKIKRLEHVETGLVAEIFLGNEWNFGTLQAIRTGPKQITPLLMKIALFRNRQVSGGFYLHDHKAEQRDGEIRPCIWGGNCPQIMKIEFEEDFFDALGVDYMKPPQRSPKAILRSAQQVWPLDRLGPKEHNSQRRQLE